jgi:cell wall-associated NlpC family hydrolase
MPINGIALSSVAAGSIFLYSAIKGKSVLATIQAIIAGQNPKTVSQTNPIIENTAISSVTGGVSPGAGLGSIAGIARSYIGRLTYHFGGPPPNGTVDCSSFVSKVLNQGGVKNPGGSSFNPNRHGPNTISYLNWNGCTTVGHSEKDAIPGDLVIGLTHMGIASGGGEYVSAENPRLGVHEDSISTFPDPVFSVRRLK